MRTPLEIRNQIYGYLLSTKHTKVDFEDEIPVGAILLIALALRLDKH